MSFILQPGTSCSLPLKENKVMRKARCNDSVVDQGKKVLAKTNQKVRLKVSNAVPLAEIRIPPRWQRSSSRTLTKTAVMD